MKTFPPPKADRSPKGFTLIELLACLAVLGILLVLLAPVYSRAVEAGSSSKCLRNLHSLAQAHILYRQDHNNQFTSARWDNPATDKANPGMLNYLNLQGTEVEATVMTCPSIQQSEFPSRRPMQMNYGLNTTATFNYHVNSLNSAMKVTHHSRYLLFTEGVVNPTLGSQMKAPYNYFTTISWAQRNTQQFVHSDKQNVIFLDGHVERLGLNDFPEGSKAHKELIWSGSEN